MMYHAGEGMAQLPRGLLLISVIVYVGIGGMALVAPAATLAPVGVVADGAAGVVEIRAMYGGLELGMAAFLGWCLAKGKVHTGVVASTLTIGGLGLARALSWVAAGAPEGLHPVLMAVELGGAALGLVVWVRGLADDR